MGMFSRGTASVVRPRAEDGSEPGREEQQFVSTRVHQAALRAIALRAGADIGCARVGAVRVPVTARLVPTDGSPTGAVSVQVDGVTVAQVAPAKAGRWRRTCSRRAAEVSAEVYLPAEDEGRWLSIDPVGGW